MRVTGTIDLTHSASAEQTENFVIIQLGARSQGHRRLIIKLTRVVVERGWRAVTVSLANVTRAAGR